MGVSPVWVGEPELTLGHSGQKRFPAAERKESALGCHCCSGGKGRWVIISFSPFFFPAWKNKTLVGNSPCVLHPLMSWCVSGSGWIFGCWGGSFYALPPGFTPTFPLLYASFSSKVGWIWTESQRQWEPRRPATWPPRFIYRELRTAVEKL